MKACVRRHFDFFGCRYPWLTGCERACQPRRTTSVLPGINHSLITISSASSPRSPTGTVLHEKEPSVRPHPCLQCGSPCGDGRMPASQPAQQTSSGEPLYRPCPNAADPLPGGFSNSSRVCEIMPSLLANQPASAKLDTHDNSCSVTIVTTKSTNVTTIVVY